MNKLFGGGKTEQPQQQNAPQATANTAQDLGANNNNPGIQPRKKKGVLEFG